MKRDTGGALLRFVVSALALGAAVSFTGVAAASPSFPEAVQDALPIENCAIQCPLCHLGPEGGPNKINKGFGQKIQQLAASGHPESISGALAALEAGPCITTSGVTQGPCDSDNDGVPDVKELRQRRDPNLSGAGNLCGPTYGCGARVARGGADFDWVALLIAGAAAATLISGSRRSRRTG